MLPASSVQVFDGAVQVFEEKENTFIIEVRMNVCLWQLASQLTSSLRVVSVLLLINCLQWQASSVNDMFADAVVTAMVQVEQRPVPIKGEQQLCIRHGKKQVHGHTHTPCAHAHMHRQTDTHTHVCMQ